jgi:hypothetical protein
LTSKSSHRHHQLSSATSCSLCSKAGRFTTERSRIVCSSAVAAQPSNLFHCGFIEINLIFYLANKKDVNSF